MRAGNPLKKITTVFTSFVMSGIDYVTYLVVEFRNPGKNDGWPIGELAKIEPMPAEVTHTHNTSSGKINLRMVNHD
jgi:hypothetical protein